MNQTAVINIDLVWLPQQCGQTAIKKIQILLYLFLNVMVALAMW